MNDSIGIDIVVYEATGAYHGAFERHFCGQLPLVKVNPLQARRFAQAQGVRAKTDIIDARMLPRMGSALELEPDVPDTQNNHVLKELQVVRGALIKDRTRLLNRHKTQTLSLTKRQTKARLEQIERQLKALEAEINTRLQALPNRAQAFDILRSIPGIGSIAAAAILIECPEIGTLDKKQIAALAGKSFYSGRQKTPPQCSV